MANWASITKVGSTSWAFVPGGVSPWYEWLNGALVRNATTETPTVYEGTDTQEPPPVELLASTDTTTAQNSAYPPIVYLQWRGVTNAQAYYVQYYTGSTWTTYAVVQENGSGYYKMATPAQTDNSTIQWRVVSHDSQSVDTGIASSTITMVCNPGVPSISGSYSAGTGLLTIASR